MRRGTRVSAFFFTATLGSIALSHPAPAAQLKVLHEFMGPDGCLPSGGVVVDANGITGVPGTLYGTATFCGAGAGTVFSLEPPIPGRKNWKFNLLRVSKGGFEGFVPSNGVTLDQAGGLFIATQKGSNICNCGSLYGLEQRNKGKWVQFTAHPFEGSEIDGDLPNSAPFAISNILYGTTGSAGTLPGSVYSYDSLQDIFTVLYNPAVSPPVGGLDVGNPPVGVTADSNGTVYGTTSGGGPTGNGTLFQISGGQVTLMHAFGGVVNGLTGPVSDGISPTTAPILDPSGTLYGTTYRGGDALACPNSPGCGTIWKFAPGFTNPVILHSFAFFIDNTDGDDPESTLVRDDATGTLYGTTLYGGTGTQCGGFRGDCGTIFQIDQDGNYQVIWEFPDGGPAAPEGQLAFFNGALFGTSSDGGAHCGAQHYLGCGTVWMLTP